MLCLKAHAKINWSLDIVGRREDGYHRMDMLMQTVELADTLWLEEDDTLTLEGVTEACAAQAAAADVFASGAVTYDESNLVFRAARLLQSACGVRRGARMRLSKAIPSGAGMGGGSADAAAALEGLNELWGLGLPHEALLRLGLSLGADIPFMLTGGLARVSGIGEVIRPLAPAPEVWLVLMQPCAGLSTRDVFTAFDALAPETVVHPRTQAAQDALLSGDLPALTRAMDNVLEGVSVPVRPALREAARALETCGALRAMMTGSGSVVYGVFPDEAAAKEGARRLRPIAAARGFGEVWVTRTKAKKELHS